MTFHLSTIGVYDIAYLGVLFTGLNYALQLWFKKDTSQRANRLLALAVGVMVLWMAKLLGGDTKFLTSLPELSLAFGPLLYLYVRKTVWPERRLRGKDLFHFGPILLQQAMYTPGMTLLTNLLVFTSVAAYLYLSHRQIESFYKGLQFQDGDRHLGEWQWLDRLLAGLGVTLSLFIPLGVIDYFGFHFSLDRPVYYPLSLLVAVMVIRTAVAVFFRPVAGVAAEASSYSKFSSSAGLKQKGIWLRKTIETGLLYRDSELTLTSLAEKVGMPAHELSRIINSAFKKNFNDFINEYRVKEVARKINDPAYKHITLLGIAYESGFSSQSTFTRMFKVITGKTPLEYKNTLKKESSPYNLGSRSRFTRVILHTEAAPARSPYASKRNFMLHSYLKIAWRNVIRRKIYSGINIAGLAVGFSAFLLIFLVVRYEQSFDQFHAHKNQLFRLIRVPRNPAHESYRVGVPFPVAPGLRSSLPQLANVSAIVPDDFVQVIISDNGNGGTKRFRETHGVFFAEPQFFDMFSFPLAAGEYRNSLKVPNNVLLTQSLGDKYFGHWQTATGKMIRMDGVPMRVCGILKDMPANTDFPIKAILSYATHQSYADLKRFMNDWGYIEEDNYCFVQLNESASPAQFKRQLKLYADKYIKPVDSGYFLSIQPLSEMHFDARYGTFDGRVFSKNLITVLSTIGIFLLVVACVNFINLSTAQSVNRAREVGVRKVMGSTRSQLILQFLGEAAFVSCFALLIALAAALLFIPVINNLLDIHLAAAALYNSGMIFFLVSTLAAVILLAGFYPAFLLSGFNPALVLKGTLSGQQGGISLRRALVVFQFFTAQALIIVTIIMVSQTGYVNTADMGFNKEAILTAELPQDNAGFAKRGVLRDELLKIPGIQKVSFGTGAPIGGRWFIDLRTPDRIGKAPNMTIAYKLSDTGFFNLFHLQFIAGRPYHDSDTAREFVVTENVTRNLGYRDPQRALGQRIIVNGLNRPIVGVVKDFHTASLRFSMVPVVMTTDKRAYGRASIKLNLAQAKPALAAMEKLWGKYYPDFAFTNSFLDDDIAAYYRQETQLAQLYKLFAAVAIFISCLGLYGLVTFMAAQRKKEIGVRKVLGAPVRAILVMLSREFTLLIAIAFLIAAPVAWYFMHNWLKQYAYRISLGPTLFVITIAGSMLVAWATVSYTAIKAALANPAISLRNE